MVYQGCSRQASKCARAVLTLRLLHLFCNADACASKAKPYNTCSRSRGHFCKLGLAPHKSVSSRTQCNSKKGEERQRLLSGTECID
eukprot:scaffold34195_cov19-Tisochrysis_lutea.AAC.3